MIWYFTPYSLEGNLGKSYNDYCKLIPDEDWICLIDGDVAFLNEKWGKHLQDLIDKYPYTGLFTVLTNRVGNLKQCYNNQLSENDSISYHRQLSLHLQREKYLEVEEIKEIISGHVMLFSKRTWMEAHFFPEELSEKGKIKYEKNIATVDNRFSKRILKLGKKIFLAKGFYCFHYYRLLEGRLHREHLGFKKK